MNQQKSINNNKNECHPIVSSFKFVVYSCFGLIMFFCEFTLNGSKAIPIQHIVNFVNLTFKPFIPYYSLFFVILGAVLPIVNKTYRCSTFNFVFTGLKVAGAILGIMAVFKIGPSLFLEDNYLPFLYEDLVMSITVLIQVSGFGFVFLMNFGLAEFLGTLMHKLMRTFFKTPGESSVDAIVSFTSGYTMAMMVTNSFYKKGIYTARESAIIATGFSTVAVSFLLIVSKVLGLSEYWNLYFMSCLFVTFAVTAVTARIYPITKIPDTYYSSRAEQPELEEGNVFLRAWHQGIKTAGEAKPLSTYFKEYFLNDAVKMVSSVSASILSIGLLGIILANMTPLFDIIGYLFYPFMLIMQIPEPLLAAKAAAIEIAEMFLPAMLVVQASLITKFTIAVTSVSAVLFFSASIPSLMATEIPIKLKDIILIWLERTVLSIILASVIAHIFF